MKIGKAVYIFPHVEALFLWRGWQTKHAARSRWTACSYICPKQDWQGRSGSSSQCRRLPAESRFLPGQQLWVRHSFFIAEYRLQFVLLLLRFRHCYWQLWSCQMPSSSHCSRNLLGYACYSIVSSRQMWTNCKYSSPVSSSAVVQQPNKNTASLSNGYCP